MSATDRSLPQGLALICRARARLFALPLPHVVETMRPLPVTPVAGLARFVLGVSLIRGAPVPVVDPGALLLEPESPRPTRFVTLRLGARHVALAVEAVRGVSELPGTLVSLPPLLGGVPSEVVSALGRLDQELLLVLEASRLLPDSAASSPHDEAGP